MDQEKREYPKNSVYFVTNLQRNQLQLSQMADQKASILMGATFVVFTICVGQMREHGSDPALLTLTVFAVVAAALSVYAVLPSVTPKPSDKPNWLFFGNFTHIPQDQFVDEMMDLLVEDESAYRAMLVDVYQNGQVLQHKKYKYLGYSYRIFLAGLLITLLVAGWEVLHRL